MSIVKCMRSTLCKFLLSSLIFSLLCGSTIHAFPWNEESNSNEITDFNGSV